MEKVWSTMEGWMSTETVELVKGKVGDGVELIITLPKAYKLVLAGTGAVIGLYWYMTRTHGYFRKLGVPGPKPGLFGAFSGYQKKGVPNYDKELMKQYGKCVGIFHGTRPVYLISDADMIRQIMVKESSTFVNRNSVTFPRDPVFRNSLVAAVDDHWKFLRNILSPTFTSGRMKEMSPLIQKCVDVLLKNMEATSEHGKKSMKMKEVFSMYTMDVIASTAFGVEVDCQADPENPFLKNAKTLTTPGVRLWAVIVLCSIFPFMISILESFGIRTMEPSASDFFVSAIHKAIQQRKEQDVVRNDFLQLMLNSHKFEEDRGEEDPDSYLEFDRSKRRGITTEEIVGSAIFFFFAGYETTSLAMAYMAYNLATNPDCQDKAIKEVDRVLNGKPAEYESVAQLQYLENAYLETLRIFPPAARTSRLANADIKINGHLIEEGVEVHFPINAIHNDPDYWPDPEKFKPDRFLPENRPKNFGYAFLAFGAGPRNCIGMRLAHMEIKMAMAAILQKYRFKPAPETKIPPDVDKGKMSPADGMVLMIEQR